jgi:hypothetical protein
LRRLGAVVVCCWIDSVRAIQLFPQGFYDYADEAMPHGIRDHTS